MIKALKNKRDTQYDSKSIWKGTIRIVTEFESGVILWEKSWTDVRSGLRCWQVSGGACRGFLTKMRPLFLCICFSRCVHRLTQKSVDLCSANEYYRGVNNRGLYHIIRVSNFKSIRRNPLKLSFAGSVFQGGGKAMLLSAAMTFEYSVFKMSISEKLYF